MTVTSYVWRPRAKYVAFIDLTLSLIGLVVVVVLAVTAALAIAVVEVVAHGIKNAKIAKEAGGTGGGGGTGGSDSGSGGGDAGGVNTNTKTSGEVNMVYLWILWIGVAISTIVTAIHVWAGFRLLKSTDLKKSAQQALGGARFYFIANLVLLLITVLVNPIMLRIYILTVLIVLVRLALIFVGYKYMSEIKVAIDRLTISKVAPL